MEKPCDNTDNGKSGKQGALLTALLSLFGLIAALLIALIVIVGISAFRSEPPVADNEIYAELADKYKYNAVELYDGVANVYSSAFVYTASGDEMYLFTNYHVSGDDVSSLCARFYGRNSYEKAGELELVGYDPYYDVALLKTATFPANPYADIRSVGTATAVAGGRILCLGNNLGYGIQAQNGIISTPSLVTNPQKSVHDSALYTVAVIGACAPLNSGNSGAAVYDMKGRLVGMNTWRVTANAAGDAVCDTCYLTPAPVIAAMYDVLVGNGQSGPVDFPMLTLRAGEYGTMYIQALHVEIKFVDFKLRVTRIDSTGTRLLSEGDEITSIGERKVEPCDFVSIVGELYKYNTWGTGEKLTLTILRGGEEMKIVLDELGRVKQ